MRSVGGWASTLGMQDRPFSKSLCGYPRAIVCTMQPQLHWQSPCFPCLSLDSLCFGRRHPRRIVLVACRICRYACTTSPSPPLPRHWRTGNPFIHAIPTCPLVALPMHARPGTSEWYRLFASYSPPPPVGQHRRPHLLPPRLNVLSRDVAIGQVDQGERAAGRLGR